MSYALATFSDLGLRVVDMEGNIVWEYPVKGVMLYGCDVDPVTGNIYGSLYNKIIEVTQAGNKVWEYTHPKLKDSIPCKLWRGKVWLLALPMTVLCGLIKRRA